MKINFKTLYSKILNLNLEHNKNLKVKVWDNTFSKENGCEELICESLDSKDTSYMKLIEDLYIYEFDIFSENEKDFYIEIHVDENKHDISFKNVIDTVLKIMLSIEAKRDSEFAIKDDYDIKTLENVKERILNNNYIDEDYCKELVANKFEECVSRLETLNLISINEIDEFEKNLDKKLSRVYEDVYSNNVLKEVDELIAYKKSKSKGGR